MDERTKTRLDIAGRTTQGLAAVAVLLLAKTHPAAALLSPISTLTALAIVFGPRAAFWISQHGARRVVSALRRNPEEIDALRLKFRVNPSSSQLRNELAEWLRALDRVDDALVEPLLRLMAIETTDIESRYFVRNAKELLVPFDASMLEDLRVVVDVVLTQVARHGDEWYPVSLFDRMDEAFEHRCLWVLADPNAQVEGPFPGLRHGKTLFRALVDSRLAARPEATVQADRIGEPFGRDAHLFDAAIIESDARKLREIIGKPTIDVRA